MKFEIIRKDDFPNLNAYYSVNDSCFDTSPLVNVDISVTVAYLNIGISSEDMSIKCIWGFSPRESWNEKSLLAPFAVNGKVKLDGEHQPGMSWRVDKDKMWESYFDKESGWYCIGATEIQQNDVAVRVCNNMLVVVDNEGKLKSVLINPVFS